VDNPPASNDPYRCVKLEWRASGPTTVLAGSTVQLGLYAVANACNTPTTDCPGTSLAVASIDALFSWNKTFLQLNPSTGPDPNPQDACVQPTACTACPIDTYNWSGTGGFSGWINDCTGDALNDPCTGGVPVNDGNARYLGFRGTNQICPDACATTAGLKISTIKFKAISGGTSQIALLPCFGVGSKTQVQSTIVVTDVQTTDVTKSLGPAITIIVTCDSHDDCNDNNACTTDTCNCTTPNCGGTCLHANNTNTCSDGLFCTVTDRCSGGVCVGTGSPCSGGTPYCDEARDQCVQCLTDAHCNTDGLACTVDTCFDNGSIKVCQRTPVNCNDNVACTTDACVEPTTACTHVANHAFCNPLNAFCSSAICDPVDGCILDHECISLDGNPCPNPASCNETTNTCGGCKQPTMVPAGARYLAVIPADQGSTPVALLVTGDCRNPNAVCVYRYVQSICSGGPNNGLNCNTDADCPKRCAGGTNNGNPCSTTNPDCPLGTCVGKCDAGTLGSTPYYKPSSAWGTAKVRGTQIRPGTTYMVHAECNFGGPTVLSSAANAATWRWGDIDGDTDVDAIDIAILINTFKGLLGAPAFEQANLWGCTPDSVINALDIAVDVDAWRGFAFPCDITCP
jgi:hypothetical protein